MGDHECPECLRPVFFGVPHECRGRLRTNLPPCEPIYWDDVPVDGLDDDVMTMHEWCAPDTPPILTTVPERACRACGCTTENACVDPERGPCRWVEWDLCSSCAFLILDDPRPREPRSASLSFFGLIILGWIVVLAVLAALVWR